LLGGERIAVDSSTARSARTWVVLIGCSVREFAGPDIDLRLIDTGEREAVERWGVASTVYIDGRPHGSVPLNLLTIEKGLAQARAARGAA
jgi:hypothetical protein